MITWRELVNDFTAKPSVIFFWAYIYPLNLQSPYIDVTFIIDSFESVSKVSGSLNRLFINLKNIGRISHSPRVTSSAVKLFGNGWWSIFQSQSLNEMHHVQVLLQLTIIETSMEFVSKLNKKARYLETNCAKNITRLFSIFWSLIKSVNESKGCFWRCRYLCQRKRSL